MRNTAMDSLYQQQYRLMLALGRPKHEHTDDFSLRHPPMRLEQRAKIFSPFSALQGFEQAIDEKRRLYVEKWELNEEEQIALDQTLRYLHERTANLRMARENQLRASVSYFVPCADENHEAYGCRGSYERFSGVVWKVDAQLRHALLIGDREIELSDLAAISIEEEA